jgi:hypothetical protein
MFSKLLLALLPLAAQERPLQSGTVTIQSQQWREAPVRHLHIRGVMNGDNAFQILLPEPKLWKERAIQFLEGGFGGNPNAGVSLESHLHALAHGAVFLESSQGHTGIAFHDSDDFPAELAYEANYAVLQYAKTRCVELYGREPKFVYVHGASGGGMRSIELMERFPGVYHGAVPLVAPSDFQVGAFEFSLFDALRPLIEPWRERLESLARTASPSEVLNAVGSLEARDALRQLLQAGFPLRSLWAVRQGPTAAMVMDYLRYKALPAYFQWYWTAPGFADADGSIAARVRQTAGEVLSVDAGRHRLGVKWEQAPDRPYGFTLRFTSGALAGQWRRVLNGGPAFAALNTIGPGLEGVQAGDRFEADNRDVIAWTSLHRHILLPPNPRPEPMMRNYFKASGTPASQQIPPEQLSQLRLPHRTTGKFAGKMILIYGADDPLIWPSLAAQYWRDVQQAQGPGAAARARLHFIEHGGHGGVPQGMESRQVLMMAAFRKALDELISWVEEGKAPTRGTTFQMDPEYLQVKLPPTAQLRGGYQPVVRIQATPARVPVDSEVTIRVGAEDPDNDLTLIEMDFEGDGVFETKQNVSGRNANVVFRHNYQKPGTYFPTARVTDSTTSPGSQFRGIQNLATVRLEVEISRGALAPQ